MTNQIFRVIPLLLPLLQGFTATHAQQAAIHEARFSRHILDSIVAEGPEVKLPQCQMELVNDWVRTKWTSFRREEGKYLGSVGDGTGVQMAATKTWYPEEILPKDCFIAFQIRYRYFMSTPDNLLLFPDKLIDFDKPFIQHSHQILYRKRQMDMLLLTGYKIVFQNRCVLEVSFGGGLTHGEIEEYQYLVNNRPAIYTGWSVSCYW